MDKIWINYPQSDVNCVDSVDKSGDYSILLAKTLFPYVDNFVINLIFLLTTLWKKIRDQFGLSFSTFIYYVYNHFYAVFNIMAFHIVYIHSLVSI